MQRSAAVSAPLWRSRSPHQRTDVCFTQKRPSAFDPLRTSSTFVEGVSIEDAEMRQAERQDRRSKANDWSNKHGQHGNSGPAPAIVPTICDI